MKYLSWDLAACFEKMSATLFSLNEVLGTSLQSQQRLNQTIKLDDKYKVDQMILKLKEGLDGWSTWCLMNKTLVTEYFANYLHFRKHELMSLKEVMTESPAPRSKTIC